MHAFELMLSNLTHVQMSEFEELRISLALESCC